MSCNQLLSYVISASLAHLTINSVISPLFLLKNVIIKY